MALTAARSKKAKALQSQMAFANTLGQTNNKYKEAREEYKLAKESYNLMDEAQKAEFKEEYDTKLKLKNKLKEAVAKLTDESGTHSTAVEVATDELKELESKGAGDETKTATSKDSPPK